jgi:putative toxin-antitoxin system antitoxin component (TIGR02293 family)
MDGKYPFKGVAEAMVPILREGYPVDVIDRAIESGRISMVELDRLVIPRKTLSHRRLLGSLTPEQSDRFSRVMRVLFEAEDTFGDPAKARAWLRRPSALLDGEAPLDRLDTDYGIRQVDELLGRISHGLGV